MATYVIGHVYGYHDVAAGSTALPNLTGQSITVDIWQDIVMLTPNFFKETGFPSLRSRAFSLMSAATTFADAIASRESFTVRKSVGIVIIRVLK